MLLLLRASRRLALSSLAALAAGGIQAQTPLAPLGVEYAVGGSIPGDQVFARAALSESGGYVVWHDNVIDGDGYGIGARRLDRNFTGNLGTFRINATAAGDQEYPQVALFPAGGAIVVWQGGPTGFPKIYARLLASDGTFSTGEILVNTYQQGRQQHPQVVVLRDSTAVVLWTSYGQDGSHDGVFGQKFNSNGAKVGAEFMVNQRTVLSQRTPSLAALPGGGFVAVWVSEKENAVGTPIPGQEGIAISGPGRVAQPYDVSIFARIFDADGPVGGEIKVNTSTYVAANPAVSVGSDGGFVIAWSTHVGRVDVAGAVAARGWDVRARGFAADGSVAGDETEVNERTFGDQFLPAVASVGNNHLVAWISLNQDGSREGIFGRVIGASGVPSGPEFQVNTFTAGSQKLPAVASDGAGRGLIVWSRARGGLASYDLYAQRYSVTEQLRAPDKPMVLALSSSKLAVSWPSLADLGAVSYEVYVDGATTPVAVTTHYWAAGQWAAGSTHAFRIAYIHKSGERSPLSEPASGVTWGEDANFDGLPDDWQSRTWGADENAWPPPQADSDGDGATNLQEFLAGTDPEDPLKVLRLRWRTTDTGTMLIWNTERGCIYQVQRSQDLKQWDNLGTPRFAAGASDSLPADRAERKAMYRVIRVR